MTNSLTIDTATMNAWDTLQALKRYAKEYRYAIDRGRFILLANDYKPNTEGTILDILDAINVWSDHAITESNPAYDMEEYE